MQRRRARQVLVEAAGTVFESTDASETIDRSKKVGRERRERKDVVWYEVLLSLSTWGNSRGAVLVTEASNFQDVQFETVREMSSEERVDHFEEALLASNVSYPHKKARYLDENATIVETIGGLEAVRGQFEDAAGRDAKITFLKQFLGIGDKYARNIGMDLHHPDFRDSIALDDRIRGISDDLGVEFEGYEDHEQFYRSVARDAGLTPWELDRLLYNYPQEISDRIDR